MEFSLIQLDILFICSFNWHSVCSNFQIFICVILHWWSYHKSCNIYLAIKIYFVLHTKMKSWINIYILYRLYFAEWLLFGQRGPLSTKCCCLILPCSHDTLYTHTYVHTYIHLHIYLHIYMWYDTYYTADMKNLHD